MAVTGGKKTNFGCAGFVLPGFRSKESGDCPGRTALPNKVSVADVEDFGLAEQFHE